MVCVADYVAVRPGLCEASLTLLQSIHELKIRISEFDSVGILSFKGGIPRSIVDFPGI